MQNELKKVTYGIGVLFIIAMLTLGAKNAGILKVDVTGANHEQNTTNTNPSTITTPPILHSNPTSQNSESKEKAPTTTKQSIKNLRSPKSTKSSPHAIS